MRFPLLTLHVNFYPRPPRGGRPVSTMRTGLYCPISIHALREEGDFLIMSMPIAMSAFLSTPSARRATSGVRPDSAVPRYFYPRPPRGGRLADVVKQRVDFLISIHALREEGDMFSILVSSRRLYFYPRPPRGGRLANIGEQAILNKISIHALREEGDE